MNEKDIEWNNYLLRIGVTNLNDEAEISRKLEEVERYNPKYQSALRDAVEEVITTTDKKSSSRDKPVKLLTREDIINWLLSLGD